MDSRAARKHSQPCLWLEAGLADLQVSSQPYFNSVRNEPAQIFAVINQSRSTETDGGSCVHLAQPKIRSGTFLATTLGRLGLLGRGNEHLAMHVGLPELRRECYFASCTCPLWTCTRLLAMSLHGVGLNQPHVGSKRCLNCV